MVAVLFFLIQNALVAACAFFAYRNGGRAERYGAIWFGVNMAFGVTFGLAGLASPLVLLIEDGIFALGLLPLAMIYVSYWMGILTLIAAALFALEATYLLYERPMDSLYMWINNSLWAMAPLVLLASGFTNVFRKRRRLRQAMPMPAGG